MSTEQPAPDDSKAAAKRARQEFMKDWQVSADGRLVTRTFPVESLKEAARFASRVVAFSGKHGVAVDLHSDGTKIVVGMPHATAPSFLLDRKQRGIAQRLERLLSRTGKTEAEAEASKPTKSK
jgi:pterin-4a-carbinolamine dehydratase